MVEKTYRVFGANGHRNQASFGESKAYDFSENATVRKIELLCADKTGTNDYVDVIVTRNTADECRDEILGQVSDGFFENVRTGKIIDVESGEEVSYNW